jgi:RimJ/RimL family protein N-acetyltransferase
MSEFQPRFYPLKDGRSALIRRAVEDDARALHDGACQVALEGIYIGWEGGPFEEEKRRQVLRDSLQSRHCYLAAEVDRKIVGALSAGPGRFGQKDAHVCHIGMWVMPGFRGVGVGSALIDSVLVWARDEGFEKVALEVFSKNTPAINLYKKFGFAAEGVLKRHYKLHGQYADGILMGLFLDVRS